MSDIVLKSCISEDIFPFVQKLIVSRKVGLCAGIIRVTDVRSGVYSNNDIKPSGDRFRIIIPYGGHFLTWDVIFFGNTARYAPDFCFDDKLFFPEMEDVPSLANWDPDDSSALVKVIKELLDQFSRYQAEQIIVHDRFKFEYSSLVEGLNYSKSDVEVLAVKRSGKASEAVNFLIRLDADFSQILPVLKEENQGENSAVLLITYFSPDSHKVTPQLFLSPAVEQALGGSANLRIPQFPVNGSVMDYVPLVSEMLKSKVKQITEGTQKRRQYINTFLSYFGTSVLEFDADKLMYISFMFEWNEFNFILHINLPLYFPIEQPILTFQSVYHMVKDEPYSMREQDYPYSPRWDGKEMAKRTRNFIAEIVPKFQKNCIKSLK
jgi:BRCA1-A complex subunit BRE